MQKFLTILDAAKYLDRNRSTLDKWRAANIALPYYQDGMKVMYAIDDLDTYIASLRVEPKGADPKESQTPPGPEFLTIKEILAFSQTPPGPDERSPLSNYQVQEIAVQAAHFMACVPEKWDNDKTEGIAGLCEICADAAIAFCAHHWPLEAEEEDYWDSADWYVCTDDWYEQHIAHLVEVEP